MIVKNINEVIMRKLKTSAIDVLLKISSQDKNILELINYIKLLRDNCNNYYKHSYSRLLLGIFCEILYPDEMRICRCDGIIEEALRVKDDLHIPENIFVNTTTLYSKLFDLSAFEHTYSIPNNYCI